jgi:hypothetical protein
VARQSQFHGGTRLGRARFAGLRMLHAQGTAVMLIVRWLALFLLLASAVCFGFYIGTGQVFYKRLGLVILKWTIIAAVVFFVVVLIERLL